MKAELNSVSELNQLPWYAWVGIAAILIAQGTWLFIDARKRNAYPWFWGIWGLIYAPLPLILYLIFVRKIYRRKKENPYE